MGDEEEPAAGGCEGAEGPAGAAVGGSSEGGEGEQGSWQANSRFDPDVVDDWKG